MAPKPLLTYGGSIPAPFTNFIMGMGHQAHITGESTEQWVTLSGDPWDAIYRYLIGGPRLATSAPNAWWNQWPGTGGMINNQLNDVASRGMVNMFIYEQMYTFEAAKHAGYTGGNNSNDYSNINNAFNNATFMGHYYNDFAALMQIFETWLAMPANSGRYIYVDMEPDVWGFMEQLAPTADPNVIVARVASAANPGAPYPNLTGLPNTLAGYGKALLRIRDQFAPTTKSRIKLAWHASGWAAARAGAPTSKGNVAQATAFIDVNAVASDINAFYQPCRAEAGIADWDLFFVDPSDGDAGLYDMVPGGNTASFTHWWDINNVTQPNFNRYRDWCNALSTAAGLRIMLWQVPIGNSAGDTGAGANGHFQDNKAEYFFNPTNGRTRVCDYASNGIIGILWGRGAMVANQWVGTSVTDYKYTTGQNEWEFGTADGCVASVLYPGAGTCPTQNDDDGGYLNFAGPNYFSMRCSLPGVGTPTPTFTRSPNYTHTVSPTITPTPNCAPGGMLADFPNTTATNNWGGWIGGVAGGGSISFSIVAPGQPGPYRARATGNNGSPSASIGTNLNAAATAVNVSAFGGIRFWFKGNIASYRINLHTTATADWDDYGYNFSMAAADTWTYMQIPFSSLAQGGWGAPAAWTPSAVISISFLPTALGAYDFSLDDVEFYCPPPAPTPTPSRTRTGTLTRTFTPTISPSRTASATPSASPSRTPTRTLTPTSSLTHTFTAPPSPSPSRTASPFSSPTHSPTLAGTASQTPTLTRTQSPTPSRTGTPSHTVTHTRSFSPTLTRTPTVSPSPSFSSTRSATPSQSPSFTATQQASPTHSPTITLSRTASPLASPTVSPTQSGSFTPQGSATPSGTRTLTSTPSPQLTPTASPTLSPSFSATPALSPTPSRTLTLSLTATRTATASATPSSTPSSSLTLTGTASFSPSPAFSSTYSPSATRTATPSSTPSLSRSPSPAFSATFSPTLTLTPVPTTAVPAVVAGPNEVLQVLAFPSTDPTDVYVEVAGQVDSVEVKIYTKSMVCLGTLLGPGSLGKGWIKVPFDPGLKASMGNDLYYPVAAGLRGGAPGQVKKGKMALLK